MTDIIKPIDQQCSMAKYEQLSDSEIEQYGKYELTDYPDNGANATQMAFALTCQRLFPAGTVVTFSGVTDSNYTNGHLYQIEVDDTGAKSWKDITPLTEQSIPVLVGIEDKPINLATDLEYRKWYILNGEVKQSDTTNLHYDNALAYKQFNNTVRLNQNNLTGRILSIDTSGNVNSITAGNFLIRINNSVYDGITQIYAPLGGGVAGRILQTNGAGKAPTWIDQTSITSKQQTYYLTELPTTTTSPYAEHDQVVVNNQDVYALEKVDSTLTWVKKYSVGGSTTVDTELADSENPVQNKAIFNALKDKLGVLGPDEHNRVYIRKDNTTDSSLPFSYTAEADSIMKRNASGQVQVATPTQDEDAVNKSYADQLQRYLSLSGDSGTLEEDQYELVKNNDNLIIQRVGLDFRRCGYPSNGQGDYIFFCDHYTKPNGSEDWLDYFITIKQDKTWETTIKNHLQVASQTYAPFVQLSPDTATNGNLTDDDYTNLTEHDDVYIILNNEYYRKADNQHTTGIISYTHQGWNGDTPQDKSINITVATKAWTLVVGKTKYYRHYVQLTSDSKALYYDFSSTQETAYTADTLPSMPDDIITAFQVVANGYYSAVSGLVYRNSEGALKVIMHGMYTTDGTNMTYLQLTGTDATFVQDIVKTM